MKYKIGDTVKVVGLLENEELFKDKEFQIYITTLSPTHPYNLKDIPLIAFSEEDLELVKSKENKIEFKPLEKTDLMKQVEIIEEIKKLHSQLGQFKFNEEFQNINVFYYDLKKALTKFNG